MWAWDRTIVEPLVRAAYDRAGGPPEGRPLLDGFLRWAPSVDRGTPLRVDADVDVHVPDPILPDTHLATREGDAVRYRDRIDLVLVDDDERSWLGEHRVVEGFAADDELRLDERAALACWAWEEIELATTITGVQYTELQLDPPGVPTPRHPALGAPRRRARPAGSRSRRGT